MLADIGLISLVLGLVASVYATVASLYGARKGVAGAAWVNSARNALIVVWPLITLSCAAMVGLLVSGDFQVEYVATVTSRAMPTYLKVTALWGGQAGSLLFWVWIAATFSALVMFRKWGTGPRDAEGRSDRALLPYVIGKASEAELAQILKKVNEKPVLTISDSEYFARYGVMVNFYQEEGKSNIKFEVNKMTLGFADLKMSSRLLKLATVI